MYTLLPIDLLFLRPWPNSLSIPQETPHYRRRRDPYLDIDGCDLRWYQWLR